MYAKPGQEVSKYAQQTPKPKPNAPHNKQWKQAQAAKDGKT
jgi:hypothetical protein